MRRQRLQGRPFEIQPLTVASIAAPDDLVDKAAISLEGVKIAQSAQQQRVLDCPLQMAVRAFNRTVLVRQASIIASRPHAVVGAQCLVAPGLILPCIGIEIAERRLLHPLEVPARSDPAANAAAVGCRAPIPAVGGSAIEPRDSTQISRSQLRFCFKPRQAGSVLMRAR